MKYQARSFKLSQTKALTLSMLACSALFSPLLPAPLVFCPAAQAASGQAQDALALAGNQALDKVTLHLINTGDWGAVTDRLVKLLAADKGSSDLARLKRSYKEGWLAFAYMFNARAQEVQDLDSVFLLKEA